MRAARPLRIRAIAQRNYDTETGNANAFVWQQLAGREVSSGGFPAYPPDSNHSTA